ncbi:MAG: DUF1800 domain-containing protein [Pyrinomonadaceae bacterium]
MRLVSPGKRHAPRLLDLSFILTSLLTITLLTSPTVAAASYADTVRFLEQSTFGPTPELISHVQGIGFPAFLQEQFNAPVSGYPDLPFMPEKPSGECKRNQACLRDHYTMYPLQTRFFRNALYERDQLRQRMAFALSQIVVVSGREITLPSRMVHYLQTIDRHAFGNYRQLLYEITRNPAMGDYLDVVNNSKARPNENYAREFLQLFSIGSYLLNPDGTPQLDAQGNFIPAFDEDTVAALARVFTGWKFARPPAAKLVNYRDLMIASEAHHHIGTKTLLNGVVLPAKQKTDRDLQDALDNIINHPNVAPFICKQLIQHLVTSNPRPAYVARVAAVFVNHRNSATQLREVVAAILLDTEARGDVKIDPDYGHLREPVQFMTNILRAFNARSADGGGQSDGYLNPESEAMGQDLFRAPSVFGHYRPDYEVPGTNILGPKFELLSTLTAIKRANFVNTVVFSRIAIGPNAPAGTSLDLSGLVMLADNPAELIQALNRLLLHGAMPEQMRDQIAQSVTQIPHEERLLRAQTALYLFATSSQYQVER